MRLRLASALVFVLTLSSACGLNATSAVGDLGRLRYSLVDEYESEATSLRDAAIVTGYQQHIWIYLTDAGEDRASGSAEDIQHSVDPPEGVTLEVVDEGNNEVPTLRITVSDPGPYTLESSLDGRFFDRITLEFDDPDHLELGTWIRGPNEVDFLASTPGSEVVSITEGSQVAFVPIPLDAQDERLLGGVEAEISANPADAIVADSSVLWLTESNIASALLARVVYFIDAGLVDLTVTETAHGAEWTVHYDVSEYEIL